MTFDKGSLILVDYTATIKETGEIFDTTKKEVAIEISIYDEDKTYGPALVSIGDNSFTALSGLSEALADTSVDEKRQIEIPPYSAFGTHDPKKIRIIPIRKLGEDAEKVSIGDPVTIGGKSGIIRLSVLEESRWTLTTAMRENQFCLIFMW